MYAALCKGCRGVSDTSSGVLASMTSRSLAKDRNSSLSRELLLILRNSSLRSSSAITIRSAYKQSNHMFQRRVFQRSERPSVCKHAGCPYSLGPAVGVVGVPLASQTHA